MKLAFIFGGPGSSLRREERGSSCWSRRAAHCGRGSAWGTGRQARGSGAVARGLVAMRRVGSSQTKGGPLSPALAGGFPFTIPRWNPGEFYLVYFFLFLL